MVAHNVWLVQHKYAISVPLNTEESKVQIYFQNFRKNNNTKPLKSKGNVL